MFPAPLILTLSIVTSPVCLTLDGPITYGLVSGIAAVLVAVVGLRIQPGEAEFLSSLVRPLAVVAVLLAVAIFIQLLPSGSIGLANPIWKSAAEALSRSVVGSITIDRGATLISLTRFLSFLAVAFVAAAVAIDRRRAGWILFALTLATSLSALFVLVRGFGGISLPNGPEGLLPMIAATDSAGLGIILAMAMTLQSVERATPTPSQDGSRWSVLRILACLVAIAVCSLAVLVSPIGGTSFALMCGIATFVVATVTRRFNLDAWGYSAILSVVLVAVIAAVALGSKERAMDLTVAFANSPQSTLVNVTQRILAETSWLGTGAGTFSDVLPIYRDFGELTVGNVAPTAASALAIEMGRPFLWVTVVASFALAVKLLRGAARRGRDSFYSTAGASIVVATTILAFINHGPLNTAVWVVVASTIGIGIAQSKSRSV